jgi:hypothetical protein
MCGMTERKFDKDPTGVSRIACTTLHAMRGSWRRTYHDEPADPADPRSHATTLSYPNRSRRDSAVGMNQASGQLGAASPCPLSGGA